MRKSYRLSHRWCEEGTFPRQLTESKGTSCMPLRGETPTLTSGRLPLGGGYVKRPDELMCLLQNPQPVGCVLARNRG
jgi:hypothetical protein